MPPKARPIEQSKFFDSTDVTTLSQKLNISETVMQNRLRDRNTLASFRVSDLRIIGEYIREFKNAPVCLRGKKHENIEAIAVVIFSTNGRGLPRLVTPKVPQPLTLLYELLQPNPFYTRLRELHTHPFSALPTLNTGRYDIKIPIRSLFELFDGEESFVDGTLKRNRVVMYLYNTEKEKFIGCAAGQSGLVIECNGHVILPEPWELKEGQQFDITHHINWNWLKTLRMMPRLNDGNNFGSVDVILRIPRIVCTRGVAVIWSCRRTSCKDVFAKVYLDAINTHFEKIASIETPVSPMTIKDFKVGVEAEPDNFTAMADHLHDLKVMSSPLAVKNTKELPSAFADADNLDEDEIQMGDQVVSFLDPLVLCRVRYPAKGRDCRHRECFDLWQFLKFHERKIKWHCAVCSKILAPETITIDAKFKSYLKLYPDSDRCVVHSDGSTSLPKLTSASAMTTLSRSQTPRKDSNSKMDRPQVQSTASGKRRAGSEVVCIDLDSGEDELMEDAAREKKRKLGLVIRNSSMSVSDDVEVELIEISD